MEQYYLFFVLLFEPVSDTSTMSHIHCSSIAWRRVTMKTAEKSTVSLPRRATDLANDKPALVAERPAVGNEKKVTHACK